MRGGSTCVTRRRESRSPRGSLLLSRLHQSRTPATTARSNERITMGCSRDRSGSTRFLGPEANEGKANIATGHAVHARVGFPSTGSHGSSLLGEAACKVGVAVRESKPSPLNFDRAVPARSQKSRYEIHQADPLARFVLAQEVCPASHRERPAEDASGNQPGRRMELHSQSRRILDGFRRPLLGRAADGSRLHEYVRVGLHQALGLGQPLAGLGAEEGSRTRVLRLQRLRRPRLLAMASHRTHVRVALNNTQGKEGAC